MSVTTRRTPPGGRCPGRDHRARRGSRHAATTTTSRRPARSPTKLVVDTFGEFGYDELVKQYEKDTGIKVELRKTAQLGEYRPKLVRYLATGKGAATSSRWKRASSTSSSPTRRNWVDLRRWSPTTRRNTCPGSGSSARRRTAG